MVATEGTSNQVDVSVAPEVAEGKNLRLSGKQKESSCRGLETAC